MSITASQCHTYTAFQRAMNPTIPHFSPYVVQRGCRFGGQAEAFHTALAGFYSKAKMSYRHLSSTHRPGLMISSWVLTYNCEKIAHTDVGIEWEMKTEQEQTAALKWRPTIQSTPHIAPQPRAPPGVMWGLLCVKNSVQYLHRGDIQAGSWSDTCTTSTVFFLTGTYFKAVHFSLFKC